MLLSHCRMLFWYMGFRMFIYVLQSHLAYQAAYHAKHKQLSPARWSLELPPVRRAAAGLRSYLQSTELATEVHFAMADLVQRQEADQHERSLIALATSQTSKGICGAGVSL